MSLLTAGAQNPMVYFNGAGYIEVGSGGFSIFENDDPYGDFLSLEQMRIKTIQLRDKYAKNFKDIGDLRVGRMTSSESRLHAQSLKKDLSPGGRLSLR